MRFAQAAAGLLSLCVGTGLAQAQSTPAPAATVAQNQSGPAEAASSDDELKEIVVTGYRASLEKSTEAKRNATGFVDSIFAEDIGKFPDTNIAESFNRIPGITIVRDIDGEGVDIAIRGLGTSFTRVLLNGAPVAVASTGTTDSQNTNREVDLNMFPTELFTQLTVQKSSSAKMIEGGAAGTVNMRSARPFDNPGPQITFSAQDTKNQPAPNGERGSFLASDTWDNGFGALVGYVGVHNPVNIKGFETIGWTHAQLSAAQCGAGNTCNTTGSGNWTIPATVPANAGNGLIAGTPINNAFLLAQNPGLTIQQINNAIIPRLGRPSDEFGDRDRNNAIASFEFRPSETLHFYLDTIYGKEYNSEQRIDMDWVGRNGAAIPLDLQVDSSTCTVGCTVTSGTFANSQFFLEYRPYQETTEFWSANPGFAWQIADAFKADFQANKTNSTFHREVPSVLVTTPASSGVTVDYTNTGGIPSIASNVDLDNPANFGWPGSRVNIQDEKRHTETKGARLNFTWGKGGPINLEFGGSYDDVSRLITAYDNSQAWQNAVCGDNPNIYVPTPNTQPGCNGLDVTGAAPPGYPTYPGLGTGFTTGVTTPLNYGGSLIPASALSSYLQKGPDGFITVNWAKFAAAGNYAAFHNAEPSAASANTGASGGSVEEKTTGLYTDLTGDLLWDGNRLRYTVGVRWVRTQQTIGGLVSIPDPRNIEPAPAAPGTELPDGSRYPNISDFVYTANTYYNVLPSGELAYNVSANTVLRFAASTTMTRPNPNSMLPGLGFSSPSADVGTIGNPALKPYLSQNLDLGVEYYTGKEGYVGVDVFRKRLTGFTTNGNTTVPFNALAIYGVTYNTLTPTQQAAINSLGGPNAATVVLTEQVNSSGALTINGLEFNWVQPLDFLLGRFGLNGFGFTANYTLIDQFGSGAAPAVALGVAPSTYNLTAYYEHGPVSVRLSEVFNKGSQVGAANQNGLTNPLNPNDPTAYGLFTDAYRQWDFSSSLDLSKMFGWKHQLQLTLDGLNLFDAKQRTYFAFTNATYTEYAPGRELMFGVRGRL